MTETIQIILTFVALATAVTFFVMWLTEKEKVKIAKRNGEMAEEDKYKWVGLYSKLKGEYDLKEFAKDNLSVDYFKLDKKYTDLQSINAELGNKIEMMAQEIKDLKRKNRIKGRK